MNDQMIGLGGTTRKRGRFVLNKSKIGNNSDKSDFSQEGVTPYWLMSDNLGEGGGNGSTDDQTIRPFFGITPDNLQDWGKKWGTFFYYTFLLLLGTAAWVWASGFLFATFPITDPSVAIIRAAAMTALHFFLIISPLGDQVTAAINPWVAMLIEVVHVFFGRMSGITYLGLLRILWFFLISFIGSVLGALGLAMWPSYDGFQTSDCGADKILACDALPFLNGVDANPSYGAMIIGTLIECIIFIAPVWMIAYDTIDNVASSEKTKVQVRRIYVRLAAFLSVPGYFIIHVVITPFVGNAFSLWNWLWLSILTNNYSNAAVYIWPPIVAMLIALIAILLYEVFRNYMLKGYSS
jgi:hypothetical protein